MKTNYVNDFVIKPGGNLEKINWSGSNGFCFDQDGKVCVVYEKEKGYWTLPGGGKEGNENPEQTFVREVLEETQAQAYDIKYFHCVYAKFIDLNGNQVKAEIGTRDEKLEQVGFRFICKLKNMQEFIPNKNVNNFICEIDERRFVTLEELPDYLPWLKDSENGRESFEILKTKI